MDIHGYDMLNLEGPRQNFGGKTAMVTMAKNFSSKRGMQYLEHPPHHHLAPWELQTHWFLQDICCNLPSMKAIPSCASLHLTGSYLGALSIHIYPPQLQGTPWKWWAAWPTAAGQTPQRRLHGCTWWAETWKRETIHQLLQHSSCLSDKSNALEFCPATKPFKFLTARFHHISPQQFMLAQGILPILFGIFGKKTLSDSWHTRMMCDWGTFPEPAWSCSDSVCCWGLLCQGQRSPANAPKSAGPSQGKRLKP